MSEYKMCSSQIWKTSYLISFPQKILYLFLTFFNLIKLII